MPFIGDLVPYKAPEWMPSSDEILTPTHRFHLAHTPTPIQRVSLSGLPESHSQILIKRDDMTGGIELSGNKVRKLEFLLADAKKNDCDWIISAGGTQSNHCRATTAASRTLGLGCSLVLRDDRNGDGGNLFLDTIMGADIRIVDQETFKTKGGGHFEPFLEEVLEELKSQKHKKPYIVPMGGSSPIGCYGYINQANELINQLSVLEADVADPHQKVSNLVHACGSGGTVTGLGIATHFFNKSQIVQEERKMTLKPICYDVYWSPEFFYKTCNDLARGLFQNNVSSPLFPGDSRNWMEVRDGLGCGYAKATTEELQFLNRVARENGIVFDRCYTNKVAFHMVKDLQSGALKPEGQLMFIHTGGGPSIFDEHERVAKCQGHERFPDREVKK